MKKIECYIQPYNLDAVAEALAVEGVVGMSVAEVKGFGVQKGFVRGEDVKPGEYRFHPKMKVEMVVLEKDVERIITAINASLKSNQIGEGKIFVLPIDDAVRTRTGERGRDAIT
ncbi:MAG TPA: P-II family nitrogen regulator [Thermoleophilia bacterium]|jgi:nitrogen regulatory protein P-II 1|nr:P-II family nitrogen regulator [Thermoleophilia bacterium]